MVTRSKEIRLLIQKHRGGDGESLGHNVGQKMIEAFVKDNLK